MHLIVPKDSKTVLTAISEFQETQSTSSYSRAGFAHILFAIYKSVVNIIAYPLDAIFHSYQHILIADLPGLIISLSKALLNSVLSVLTIPAALLLFIFPHALNTPQF